MANICYFIMKNNCFWKHDPKKDNLFGKVSIKTVTNLSCIRSTFGTVNENPFLAPVNLMLVSCVMCHVTACLGLVWDTQWSASPVTPAQPIIRPGPDPDYCEIRPSNWITWCNVETRLWFWSSDLILIGHLNDFL